MLILFAFIKTILKMKMKVKLLSRVWLFCDPVDCSPPGSSVLGILQARILEGVAISFPGDLSAPGIKSASPALAGRFFTTEPLWKPIQRTVFFKAW